MIVIKNQKLILLGAFLGVIMFIIPISNVVAPPPPAAEKPYMFNTLHGTKVSGDLDDLQNFDNDVVHWKGNLYYLGNPLLGWAWIVQPALYYDDPGAYEYVFLTVKFRYDGAFNLRIIVYYDDGTHDEFPEPSTGGSYVTKFYMLDSYKSVSYICFYSAIHYWFGGQQHVYIDCAEVGYSSFW